MADKPTYPVFQVVREVVTVNVDPEDVISIAQATRLAGEIGLEAQSMSGIMRKMDKGDLPTYYTGDPRVFPDGDKYTSRKAVEALPKVKGDKVKNTLRKVYSSENSPYPRIKLALTSIFAPRGAFAMQ